MRAADPDRMRLLGIAAFASLLAGCGNASVLSTAASSDHSGPDDALEGGGACAKIEGSQIGLENLTIEVGSKLLTFHSWELKEGEAGEYIGFSWAQTGALSVRVKAGTDVFDAQGGSWANADADEHAISNVEGCDPDDGEGEGDDPDDGDGGGNPDDDPSGDLPDNN